MIFAFVPVLALLVLLRLLDGYKLTPRRRILIALGAGFGAAGASYFVNSWMFGVFGGGYARVGAPVVEELLKAGYWVFLIQTARVAFMVDAGICGFAVGAGFALLENFFYLQQEATATLGVTLLRGFGTAFMHGGVAAIGAMVSVYVSETWQWEGVKLFVPGWAMAVGIHACFNQGWLGPLTQTLVMLVVMPVLIVAVFLWGENAMRNWLGTKLDEDIELLEHIARGELQRSRSGVYLQSLADKFAPEIRGDMLCMLQITAELSMRAKGDLLLREAGMEVEEDPGVAAQFEEMAYLEKSIGPTGMLALKPLLNKTPRDLWELRRLAGVSS